MLRGCLLALVACGGKQPGTWIERDVHESPVHETRTGTTGAPAGVRIDLGKLDAATIDELDDATAHAALDQLADHKPAARVALRAARLAHHRGDDAEARALLARAASAADEAEVHADLAALAASAATHPVDANTIAVLLPLTGKLAGIGAELRRQIEQVSGPTWLFFDTKGE